MAVDTRNKRASAFGIALGFIVQLPLADGTIAAADRAQQTYTYSGITVSAPVTGKAATHVTKLGTHGYMKVPVADGSFTKDPNAAFLRDICTLESLICTRAVTLSTDIDTDVITLDCDITEVVTLETLICTRAVTLESDIDDSVTTLDTEIGC